MAEVKLSVKEDLVKIGLHMCDNCIKINSLSLKELIANRSDQEDIRLKLDDIKADTERISKEMYFMKWKINTFDSLTTQLAEIKKKIADVPELDKKITDVSVTNKKWSEVVSKNGDTLVSDMKSIRKSVANTDNKLDVNSERNLRKNNIVIYNLPEYGQHSKEKDKETAMELLKTVLQEQDFKNEIENMFRIGQRSEDTERPRPLLVKFTNSVIKSLILAKCSKLKGLDKFSRVIINHDFTKEDRAACRSTWEFSCNCLQKKNFRICPKLSLKKLIINEGISIVFLNVDSVSNIFSELMAFVESLRVVPEVITLVEVNQKHSKWPLNVSEFQINGYRWFSSGFAEDGRRGVLIYCRIWLQVYETSINSFFQEHLSITISFPGKRMNIIAIYRSPSSDSENNLLLLKLMSDFIMYEGYKVIVGDFNFPDIDWKNLCCHGDELKVENRFLDFINDKFLIQHFTEPSRMRKDQEPHLLDLLISDEQFVSDVCYFSPIGSSDHVVFSFMVIGVAGTHKSNTEKFCFDLGDYSGFAEAVLRTLPVQLREDNAIHLQQRWNIFRTFATGLTARFVPKRLVRLGTRFPIPQEIRDLIVLKHSYWKRTYKYGENTLGVFRRLREEVKKAVGDLKTERESQIAIQCRSDPKRFWRYVKNIVHSLESTSVLICSGREVTDEVEKANVFAEYFASVYEDDVLVDETLELGTKIPEEDMEELNECG